MIKLIITGLCILCLLNITAYAYPVNKLLRRRKGTQGLQDDDNGGGGTCSYHRLDQG